MNNLIEFNEYVKYQKLYESRKDVDNIDAIHSYMNYYYNIFSKNGNDHIFSVDLNTKDKAIELGITNTSLKSFVDKTIFLTDGKGLGSMRKLINVPKKPFTKGDAAKIYADYVKKNRETAKKYDSKKKSSKKMIENVLKLLNDVQDKFGKDNKPIARGSLKFEELAKKAGITDKDLIKLIKWEILQPYKNKGAFIHKWPDEPPTKEEAEGYIEEYEKEKS